MSYNPKYYKENKLWQLNPIREAFTTYETSDKILVGTFQGNRGANPELDVKVRILPYGENRTPILPPHTYWVVDLMLKCEKYNKEVLAIASYYLDFYDKCTPFNCHSDRIDYRLQTRDYIICEYNHIQQGNSLSLDYVSIIVELFCINEKQTPNAYMFRDLLKKIHEYANGKANYLELLEAAKPGFR